MIGLMNIKTECTVCDTKIWENDGQKLKKSPEYNEVDVMLNDSSKMKVGVCSKHTKPKKPELDIITKKNFQGWMEEIALGVGSEVWVKSVGKELRVTGLA
jgi:hypothetical protein